LRALSAAIAKIADNTDDERLLVELRCAVGSTDGDVARALADRDVREIEAARFLDAIVENIPDMVFVKEAGELRFVRFNRAGEELLGIPRAELIGKSDRDFFPPSEAEFFVEKDRETLRAKALVDIPEEPIQTRGGQRWLATKKVPIIDDQGRPAYLLGISRDITERKRAEAAIAAAREAADAAHKELEAFSYSVAHDLRAPLRAIDGFSQAIVEDHAAQLGSGGLALLARVRAAAQRMGLLIDDLLALSRVTRAEIVRSRVDVAALVRTTIAGLLRGEPTRVVALDVQPDLRAEADARLLAIVLDNLLANAWKFTSKRADARIEIGAQSVEGARRYFVRDNGAGFDMAYSAKLFGVFERLHPAGEYPGTGIGLATVKRIVERHGGRAWAESAVGQGATFYFTLGET
jgi:PAS domain S-box-containing protein